MYDELLMSVAHVRGESKMEGILVAPHSADMSLSYTAYIPRVSSSGNATPAYSMKLFRIHAPCIVFSSQYGKSNSGETYATYQGFMIIPYLNNGAYIMTVHNGSYVGTLTLTVDGDIIRLPEICAWIFIMI